MSRNQFTALIISLSELFSKDKNSPLETFYDFANATNVLDKNSLPRQIVSGTYDTVAKPVVKNLQSLDQNAKRQSYDNVDRLNELYRAGLISQDELKQAFKQTIPGGMIGQDNLAVDENGIRKASILESTLTFGGQVLDAGGTAASFVIPGGAAAKGASTTARVAATVGADAAATGASIAGQGLKGELTPESAALQVGMTLLGNAGNVAGKKVVREIPEVQKK